MNAAAGPGAPLAVLKGVFGFDHFRGAQQDIIGHVSAGGDALVLMPTGGGKSLCYQIPALVREQANQGLTVVVSPLIALMHDQVAALLEQGVRAAFLNSTQSPDQAREVERRMLSGELTLLYVAPERVTTARFLAQLEHLHARQSLSLFAIDEAHCVSQWGHDFRPEYRALTVLHERFGGVPRMALTATADALTRQDIVERLQLEGARQFVSSFDRPNIYYTIVEKMDPTAQLLRFIQDDHPHQAGIVYCQSRRRVEEVAQALCCAGLEALPYHAGMDNAVRQANQDRFLRGDEVVMVATIAFGMGIDKPDVRFVAHLDMPRNIEGYYQETGRAGRDGQAAQAWMCYGLQDVVNQRRMIDEGTAPAEFKQVMRAKLDALLGLAEATDCRRVRLLDYFGEAYLGAHGRLRCGHCDNCSAPPQVWDGSDAAQKLLSAVYRAQQHSGFGFGAGHIVDTVRGKRSEKVLQHGHDSLSCFAVGAEYSEAQLRAVLRQLLASGALAVDGSYNTLALTTQSRAVLKGEKQVLLRPVQPLARKRVRDRRAESPGSAQALSGGADGATQERFLRLKAWRAEVARQQNLPAYVIFHDVTLHAIAQRAPVSLSDLHDITGMGARKLDSYGAQVLQVCAQQPVP